MLLVLQASFSSDVGSCVADDVGQRICLEAYADVVEDFSLVIGEC